MDMQKSKWQVKIVGLHAFDMHFQLKVLSSNLIQKLFSDSIAGILFHKQEPSPPKKTKTKAKPKVTNKSGWSSTLLQF